MICIEYVLYKKENQTYLQSASARGLWIEIVCLLSHQFFHLSASARSLRIEILEIKISMRNSDRQLPQGSCGDINPL